MNNVNLEIAKKSNNIKIRELALFCACYEKIYIYGAGLVCYKLLPIIANIGVRPSKIIVTSVDGNKEKFENIDVCVLDEIKPTDDVGIVIGVAYYNMYEIYDKLIEQGWKDNQIYIQNMFENYICRRKDSITNSTSTGFFSEYKILDDIGKECKTDKSSNKLNYLNKYEFFLERLKDREEISVIEMGVLNGASLGMWRRYFHKATIIGVDIDERCKSYEDKARKIVIEIGDLGKDSFIDYISNYKPKVIIDDASHIWSHQIKCLIKLFPKLQNGGIYILEDIVTSFSMWEGYGFDDISFNAYDFLMYILEMVSSGEPIKRNFNKDKRELVKEAELIAKKTEMISFINGSCIIVKK